MENDKFAYIGVDAIIRNHEGKILLMHRTCSPYEGYWGLITGLVGANESVSDALKRVAREEVGIDIAVEKYTGRYYDEVGRHPTKTCICLPHVCRIVACEPNPIIAIFLFFINSVSISLSKYIFSSVIISLYTKRGIFKFLFCLIILLLFLRVMKFVHLRLQLLQQL